MRPTTIIGGVALLTVVALTSSVGAGEIIEGVVTAVYAASLQIDSETYVVTSRTVYQDKAGRRVSVGELRAGTPVEAEIEDGGNELGVVTVDLLR